MSTLNCIETYIDQEQNHYGCFVIEPLETGQGITLGNALRRTLLSDLTGFSITGVRINDLKHEFSIVEGLREDILEVLLNLKEVVFNTSFIIKQKVPEKQKQKKPLNIKGFLQVKGPIIVTAGMFKLPREHFKILNPNQYICTIVDDSELYMEIDIESGKGYKLVEEIRSQGDEKRFSITKPSTLLLDAIFMPVKRVNYKIKMIHDSHGNIKESLTLEILTNGSITPRRSLQEALKILMNLFYPLFITENFLKISSNLTQSLLKNKFDH
jgi:DNA-directed RNA polymerase subunit alpha